MRRVILSAVLVLLGCGREDAPAAGICHDCVLPSDCASDTCTTVYNEETGKPYSWACVPSEYDPLRGAKQDSRWGCKTVSR